MCGTSLEAAVRCGGMGVSVVLVAAGLASGGLQCCHKALKTGVRLVKRLPLLRISLRVLKLVFSNTYVLHLHSFKGL